jgi:hypothetical protein
MTPSAVAFILTMTLTSAPSVNCSTPGDEFESKP